MDRIRSLSSVAILVAVLGLTFVPSPTSAKECTRKPSTCMKWHIRDQDFPRATVLYNHNRELFQTPKLKKRRDDELRALAEHFGGDLYPRIEAAGLRLDAHTFDPLNPSSWNATNNVLRAATTLVREYRKHSILQEPEYKLASFPGFASRVEILRQRILDSRSPAFLAYDHTQEEDFFSSYPDPEIDQTARSQLVNKVWPQLSPTVLRLDRPDLVNVISAWTDGDPPRFKRLFGAAILRDISDAYYTSLLNDMLAQSNTSYSLLADGIKAANEQGLQASEELKSKFLLVVSDAPGDPEVNFNLYDTHPFNIARDLPDAKTLASYDVVLVVAVTSKKLDVRTTETKTVKSKFHAGDRTDTNPAYIQAQATYNAALNNYNIANGNYNQSVVSGSINPNPGNSVAQIMLAVAAGKARDRLTAAQNNLQRTSPMVSRPVYQDYEFSASAIAVDKQITGKVAMITPASPKARVSDFGVNAGKTYRVAVGAHSKDAGSARHYKTAKNLKAFQSQKVTLAPLDYLTTLDTPDAAFTRVGNATAFVARLTKPESPAPVTASLAAGSRTAAAAKASHPSIKGVAVVKSPLGGLGSGFFVTGDLLLTNYHVVEGLDLIQLEFYDGRSATGRVIARDIDRDLALVRSNARGQPLEFYGGTVLPLGDTVTAIGHPSGLKFTITKGIISAVREQQAMSSNGLGADYLFVQTDTAISPGSSGGPLMLDGRVVGINTEKLVGVNVEGIGFALHFTEIARFLAGNMQ